MRRADREITDRQEILNIMGSCDVCRLALNDPEGYPYILPLNFGMEEKDGRIILYFHGAAAGKKFDLMAMDPRAGFEMDCDHVLSLESSGNCTMAYRSVIGHGRLSILPEAEKPHALGLLMAHYRASDFPYNKSVVPKTCLFRLTVESLTAKARRMPVK